MDIFKQAAKEKLRFSTSRGQLSAEQLFDLSIDELDALAVSLDTAHQQSARKSFVVKTTAKDKTAKLRFDVALEVLNTRVAEMEAATEAAEIKAHNEKLLGLIADKKDETLKGKSIKQLEAMLR